MSGKARSEELLSFESIFALEKSEYLSKRRNLRLNAKPEKMGLTSVCLSGGGVRSGSFCLGVLIALAEAGILKKFDYLSTVSGGGYIGALISRWAHEKGIESVETDLKAVGSFKPGRSALHHLLQYISYLTPRTGALSLDTLATISLVIRNLLVNWLIVLPTLFLVALLPAMFEALIKSLNAPPIWPGILVAAVGLLALYETLKRRPSLANIMGEYGDTPFSQLVALYSGPIFVGSLGTVWTISSCRITPGAHCGFDNYAPAHDLYGGFLLGSTVVFISAFAALLTGSQKVGARASMVEHSEWSFLFLILQFMRDLICLKLGMAALVGIILLLTRLVEHAFGSQEVMFLKGLIIFFPLIIAIAIFASDVIFTALIGNPPWGDLEREWTARSTGSLFPLPMLWCALSACVFFGMSFQNAAVDSVLSAWQISTASLASAVAGLIALALANISKMFAVTKTGIETWRQLGTRWAANLFLAIFAFFLFSLFGLLGRLYLDGFSQLWSQHSWWWLVLLAIVPVAGIFVDFAVVLNKFSLHNIYRNRIIRTFVGASNPDRGFSERSPKGFLDFFATDNIELAKLRPFAKTGENAGPLHIVNMSLNIPGSTQLALQERKALPFSASPLHVGSLGLRRADDKRGYYRPSAEYASSGANTFSLGSAIAISGAAVDPSMGHFTRTSLRMLLTFFNVRLGVWLGNPGPAGNGSYTKDGPRFMLSSLIREFAGMADESSRFVHLSDGGHFENLAMYEALARRSAFILVVDAGCDPLYSFDDLGDIQRIAEVDLEAVIEFDATQLSKFKSGDVPVVLGKVHYHESGQFSFSGDVAYVKPRLAPHTQPSIAAYHSANSEFPHETTANQWFNESQFLAYMKLGQEQGNLTTEQLKQAKLNAIKGWL